MSHVYTLALGLLNAATLEGDVRAALVMTNTTADTEVDAEFIDDITTLDECDSTGYARVALTSEDFAVDLANNRFEFTADPVMFSALASDATRQIAGLLLLLHVTDDTDSKPLVYFNGTGFPFTANDEDVTISPNTEFAHVRNAD